MCKCFWHVNMLQHFLDGILDFMYFRDFVLMYSCLVLFILLLHFFKFSSPYLGYKVIVKINRAPPPPHTHTDSKEREIGTEPAYTFLKLVLKL